MDAGAVGLFERLIRDKHFGAAIIAAPIFWTVLWFVTEPSPEWGWPLAAPDSFFLLAVVYPVLEEIVFRGALQGWLWSFSWGRANWQNMTVANVVTSVAFTLAHLLINPVSMSLAVFIPSLVFGYFRDRYNQLYPSVLLHIFYNAGFLWMFTRGPAG
jgi:membrane protease YdiL (CAAX protease family)